MIHRLSILASILCLIGSAIPSFAGTLPPGQEQGLPGQQQALPGQGQEAGLPGKQAEAFQLPRMLIIRTTQNGKDMAIEYQEANCPNRIRSEQEAIACNELSRALPFHKLSTGDYTQMNLPDKMKQLFDVSQNFASEPLANPADLNLGRWFSYSPVAGGGGFYGYGYTNGFGYGIGARYSYPSYGYYNNGYYYPYDYDSYYYGYGPYNYYYYYNPYYYWP